LCAVVGVFNVENAAKIAYFSLFSMQHRGQEASGISSSDGNKLHTIKDRGLVTNIFSEDKLKTLKGNMAVGHNRYSTAGDDSILDAQPVFARYDLGEISIVHNGNLTNRDKVRNKLIKKGAIFQTFMDTENLIHLIAKSKENDILDRVKDAIKKSEGAFSIIIMTQDKMFVVRDKYGFRPLSIAKLNEGFVVSSESCAFDLVNAEYIRDVKPGELLVFERGKAEPESIEILKEDSYKCIFEYIYFARPDSNIFGKSVYELRKNMGRELAKELPVEADMVIPIPDSGVVASLGYSEESKIPFELGVIRNHYVGRTFIEPTQEIRNLKVKLKLNPIANFIKGKKVVVIDDSIVRGTTSLQIVKMLREAGASEIHMRISAPPTKGPCYYGIDTPTESELISNKMSIEEVRDYIGADTLAYLSIDGLLRSVNDIDTKYCKACFDGEYLENEMSN